MSDDTWFGDNYHNYGEDLAGEEDMISESGLQRGDHMLPLDILDVDEEGELDLQIAKQTLAVLTKKRALQRWQAGMQGQSGGRSNLTSMARLYEADWQAKKKDFEKPPEGRDSRAGGLSQKRYIVEVNASRMPIGRMKHKWLTSIWGHSVDLDFSADRYQAFLKSTLLNIKQRI